MPGASNILMAFLIYLHLSELSFLGNDLNRKSVRVSDLSNDVVANLRYFDDYGLRILE